ncbi:hypothetical protein AB0M43_02090 [Longispora sp. NPDC051575]|uniref:hypothetical protein n=1 Tax=Longispora sp. NPDC051575 TaxID=3154943 RepID=UPI00341D1698
MTDTLSRRYRLLLRAYPPGPRRVELLDTLLDLAAPGRRAPTARETANLLRHGLRARLGRPRSRGVVVFAVLVAVTLGFLGAAGAHRLAWETARPLPTGAEAESLKAAAFPGLAVRGDDGAPLFETEIGESMPEYGSARYRVEPTAATRDFRAYGEAARDRLRAAGWRIRAEGTPFLYPRADPEAHERGQRIWEFWATRDGLALTFTVSHESEVDPRHADRAELVVSRTAPAWTGPAGALGAILGALAGWFLTGWVSRRTEGRTVASVVVSTATALALLQLAVPWLLLASLLLRLGAPDQPELRPTDPFWTAMFLFGRELPENAAKLGVLVLAVAAWPLRWTRRRDPARRRSPRLVPAVTVAAVGTLTVAGLLVYGMGLGR